MTTWRRRGGGGRALWLNCFKAGPKGTESASAEPEVVESGVSPKMAANSAANSPASAWDKSKGGDPASSSLDDDEEEEEDDSPLFSGEDVVVVVVVVAGSGGGGGGVGVLKEARDEVERVAAEEEVSGVDGVVVGGEDTAAVVASGR